MGISRLLECDVPGCKIIGRVSEGGDTSRFPLLPGWAEIQITDYLAKGVTHKLICPTHSALFRDKAPRKPRKDKGIPKTKNRPTEEPSKPQRASRRKRIEDTTTKKLNKPTEGTTDCSGCQTREGCKITGVAEQVTCWEKKQDKGEINES